MLLMVFFVWLSELVRSCLGALSQAGCVLRLAAVDAGAALFSSSDPPFSANLQLHV